MVRAIQAGRKTQTRRVLQIAKKGGKWSPLYQPKLRDDGLWSDSHCEPFPCPYGKPSDRLWVRETWLNNALEGYDPVWFYRADDSDKPADRKWKPSIFMPRSASRLTLKIVKVRVERLREISMADVLAEGCMLSTSKTEPLDYQNLWESINGRESWQANPWVWVISFEKISNAESSGPSAPMTS